MPKYKYTICFDTICTGYNPVMTEKKTKEGFVSLPVKYTSKKAAEAEINSDPEFYEDCFVCTLEEIGHKTIYYGDKQ